MAYTDMTPNYDLPQWNGTDHPEFINDLKPAFAKIDSELFIANTNASTASDNATTAITRADNAQATADANTLDIATLVSVTNSNTSNISTLQSNVSTLQNDVVALQGRVDTAENDIDTLESSVATAENDIDTLEAQVGNFNFVTMDQSTYDALGTYDPDTIYFVTADVV